MTLCFVETHLGNCICVGMYLYIIYMHVFTFAYVCVYVCACAYGVVHAFTAIMYANKDTNTFANAK